MPTAAAAARASADPPAGLSGSSGPSRSRATRNHARSRRNAHPGFHHDFPLVAQQHVHPRSELDQPDPLAGLYMVARLLVEDDAPRDQPRNLLENHCRSVALYGHDVLLVRRRTLFLTR